MTNNPGWTIVVQNRVMRVTVDHSFVSCGDDFCPVDIRDISTRLTSQALIDDNIAHDLDVLRNERQFRDAVRSVYFNSTGTSLPDDFVIR